MAFITLFITLLAVLCSVSYAQDLHTPSACTHYGSTSGVGGGSCPFSVPCTINRFWQLAVPGNTLCLFDGVYTETITPPVSLAGSAATPITVRALNDGQVTIDAQHGGFAVKLSWSSESAENEGFVIEGINAKNGVEATISTAGRDTLLRRVIAYDGTTGEQNSFAINVNGYNARAVDCAGWGTNIRKVLNGSQGGDIEQAGFKRCWGEWNDWPDNPISTPTNTYQMGYNTTNQLFENLLGTWDSRGDEGAAEGVVRVFYGGGVPPFNMGGTKVLGSTFYTLASSTYTPGGVFGADEVSSLYMEDVVAFLDSTRTTIPPFYFADCIVSGNCTGNVCQNCLSVHAGTSNFVGSDSGWTTPSLHNGNGLAAATGGTSAFLLLPGICKRYEAGSLTATPLWPWPMDLRIKQARVAQGYRATYVTDEIISILGAIPSTCLATKDRANVGGRMVSGEFTMGPILTWSTRSKVLASIDATSHTATAVTLKLTIEVSYDDGASWKFLTSTERKGGSVADTSMYATLALQPQVGGVRRQLRAKVNLASGSFVSSGGFIEAVD